MVMIGYLGEQERHYIPLSRIINTKIYHTKQYAMSSVTIMFYLEDMVVQKKEITLFILFALYPNDPHLYYNIFPTIIIIGKTNSLFIIGV